MSIRNVINSNFYQIANSDANLNITGITVANLTTTTANLGNISNVNISGGSNGQYLQTDGTGNLTFANVVQGVQDSISNGTSSVGIPTANGNVVVRVANSNLFTLSTNTSILSSNLTANNISTGIVNASGNITALGFTTTGNLTSNRVTTGAIVANGNVNFTGTNVSLGIVSNLRITGGSNGQYLRTDGNGNIAWAFVSGGNGDYSNANVAAYLPLYNGNLGNVNGLTATGNVLFLGSNISLGSVANIRINGGSNGQVLTTNGAGGLSWANMASGNANIPSQFLIPTVDFILNGNTATFAGAADELLNWSFTSDYLPQGSNNTGWQANLRVMPTSALWRSAVWGDDRFVAVATNSSIAAISFDGITWTQTSLPSIADWSSVAYGANTFVAVAGAGVIRTTIAATSPDGVTWTQRSLPTSALWRSVAYGDGTFVAVAFNSNIAATSPDGITWTQRTLPVSARWFSVAYGDGTFVAVAQISSIAATSPDGITWTQRTLPVSAGWGSVTYGAGIFVAVAGSIIPSTTTATSPDGITWTQRTLPDVASQITYSNNTFVAFSENRALTSFDSINWTVRVLPTTFPSPWIASSNTIIIGGTTSTSSAAFSAVTDLPTTYNITFPADQIYPPQTLSWVPNAANTYIEQASSLGNAITTLRPTYTASYPASGNVIIDTNSTGNLPDVTVAQVGTPPTGNLTLTITQGSGIRDRITINDPDTGQSFTYTPAFGESLSDVINGMAVHEDIGRWLTAYVGATGTTGILRLDNIYTGTTPLTTTPTIAITRGSNSTLTATTRVGPGT